MLGIVFTGGKAPPPQMVRSLLNNLDSSTLLVAADSGLDIAEKAGLKPHWIIGDMDSLDNSARLDSYQKERIIRFPVDKDYTDTELAFSLLREKGFDDIWIIGGGGDSRIDHLFGIRSMLERDFYPSRWYLDTADIYCIEADSKIKNKNGTLNLELKPGSVVSVFPLGPGPWKITSQALKWPLDNLQWSRGELSLSNIAQSGKIMLNSVQGRFMVLVPNIRRTLCPL